MSEVVVVLFYFSERRVVIAEESRDLSVYVFYKALKVIIGFLSVFLFIGYCQTLRDVVSMIVKRKLYPLLRELEAAVL